MSTAKKATVKKSAAKKKAAPRKPGNIPAAPSAGTDGSNDPAQADKPILKSAKTVRYIREAGAPDEALTAIILDGKIGGSLSLEVESGEILHGVMPNDQVPYGEHYYEPIA